MAAFEELEATREMMALAGDEETEGGKEVAMEIRRDGEGDMAEAI